METATHLTEDLSEEDLARSSLVAFSAYVDPTWAPFPHSRLAAEKLEDVERGAISKLMIFMPGQHGKSTLVSRNFPAWCLGRNPELAVILATYGATYSALWGRRARDVVQRFGPGLFGIDVRKDSSAADHWELAGHRGVVHTAGVDGPVTGHPCDIFVIDDPIKTREEAESPVMREKAIEWYKSSVVSRRPKRQVLLMTRWHEQDLAGWLLETEKGEWTVLSLPALAGENDELGRVLGQALCPAFLTVEDLVKIRRTVGSYVWASMWEQRPTPLGGGLFKRKDARYYRLEGDEVVLDDGETIDISDMTTFVTCDTATSSKDTSDHTAISLWGLDPRGRLFLLDLDLDQIEGPEIMRRIVIMCGKRPGTIAWVEENSTSKHLLSFMETEGIPFKVLAPGSTDKLTRAIPASAMWERHQVFLPRDAEFLVAVERQLYRFTGAAGGEDDFVDTFSYAVRTILENMAAGELLPIPNARPNRQILPAGYTTRRPRGF